MARIELLCPSCGAADMTRDACARWNVETGDWELSAIYDTMTCDACGDETYECAEIDLDTLPEEGSDEWLARAKDAAEKTAETGCVLPTIGERYLAWAYLKSIEDEPHAD
jgi:hypothetical protein